MTPYFEQDGIALYLGDCREVLPEISLGGVDAIATDPPYASAAATATTGWAKERHGGNWGDMSLVKLMVEATLTPFTDAHALWWFADQHSHAAVVPVLFRRYSVVQTVVWDRDQLGLGAGYRRQTEFIVHARMPGSPAFNSKTEADIIRLRPDARQSGHPAEKPVALLYRLLKPVAWRCVADPYMGSGTTLVVAKMLGRSGIGIEIEERYAELAATRVSRAVRLPPDDLFGAV